MKIEFSGNPLETEAGYYHKVLLSSDGDRGREYLEYRGILDMIEAFNIGYSRTDYFADRVTFPIYDIKGEVKNITSRLVSRKKSKGSHRHLPKIKMDWLFNEKKLAEDIKYVIIVESPIDCITLEKHGFHSIACMGVSNFNKAKALKIDSNRAINNVYICFDNDLNNAGQIGAFRVADLVANNTSCKVYNVHIPFLLGPDVNAMYLSNRREFKDAFRHLKRMRVFPNKRKDNNNAEYKKIEFDLVEIAGRYTDLKPCGNNKFRGLCPIHEETTPSFYVDKGGWFICFGCGKKGNAVNFIRAVFGENLPYDKVLNIISPNTPLST